MVEQDNLQTLERMIYAAGDLPKPATNANHIRIYNHNLCPFSARTRYAFSAKQIPFQDCQIDLNNKAQWHIDVNGGAAPVMETPQGELIPDSGVLVNYALESSPNTGI